MTINLLPWREQRAVRRARNYGLLLAASLIAIGLLTVGMHYFLNFLAADYQSRTIRLAQTVNSIHLSESIQQLSADYQTDSQQIKIIQTVRSNQANFWREIVFLQKNLPKNMQLTHLTWLDNELSLHGTTTRSEQIGLLIKTLEFSQFFSHVLLERITKNDNEIPIHFIIRAQRI